ncbi:hypothetical protein [Ktedonospora formicarum]|uniref:Uncharacterized protein n=1 Tax=Ktedonospora formicarum TaxID=2778364 RepID=A0A8J3I9U9_9CHLR|nr:hypothetical protein [Ktedonospora formicarum]GHO51291.1 hypothetical protein KSX_94540 [Ktedonospora formicarum]
MERKDQPEEAERPLQAVERHLCQQVLLYHAMAFLLQQVMSKHLGGNLKQGEKKGKDETGHQQALSVLLPCPQA